MKKEKGKVLEYLDTHMGVVEKELKDGKKRLPFIIAFLVVQVITSLVGMRAISFIALITMLGIVAYDLFIAIPRIKLSMGRVEGCIDTLYILGLVDDEPLKGGKKDKKDKSMSMWQRMKEKLVAKNYGVSQV